MLCDEQPSMILNEVLFKGVERSVGRFRAQ